MKKRYIFSLAAMALLTAACSSDEMALNPADQPAPVEQKIPFTAVISADAAGTRALTEASDGKTITAKWEKEEKVALIHGSKTDVLKVDAVDATTGAATISGDITSPTDGESVFVVYVGHDSENMTKFQESLTEFSGTITEQQISQAMNSTLTSQDGTLKGISDNFDFRQATAKFAVKDSKATFASEVEMPASYAIWKLNLTTDGTTALKAKQLSMQRKGDEEAHAAVDLGTETSSEFYLAFIPSTQANAYTFEATDSDEKTYSCTPTVSTTLSAGKFYRSTLTMTSGNTYRVYTSGTAYTDEAIPSDAVTVTSTTTTWAAGTYLVSDEVTINANVSVTGAANFILKDGASLTVNGTITGGGDLTIYGQELSTGKLDVVSNEISVSVANLAIHGGVITVTATSGSGGMAAINTVGDLTISGATTQIDATGGDMGEGILAGGTITINGGNITARAGENGIGLQGNTTISGGIVTAIGGDAASSDGDGRAGYDGALTMNGGKFIATGGAGDGTGADGPGISDGSTIALTGVTMYEGDSADPETPAESQTACTKRYVVIQ